MERLQNSLKLHQGFAGYLVGISVQFGRTARFPFSDRSFESGSSVLSIQPQIMEYFRAASAVKGNGHHRFSPSVRRIEFVNLLYDS